MPKLRLESELDSLDLGSVALYGTGVEVTSGVLGFGLPPVSVQWAEGAGDGATYRGQRVLPRDIDLPLDIVGRDREHLKELVSRLAKMLAGTCTLVFVEDDETEWTTKVNRVGGGEFVYGVDTTGERDLQMVVTLRAGDPFFTSAEVVTVRIGSNTSTGFVDAMAEMNVSASQTTGDIMLDNLGDARAYPVWEVTGPGTGFKATSPAGDVLYWVGTLADGERLFVNTMDGSVRDGTGANRYSSLAAAPRFWSIPPGLTTAKVELSDISPTSKVVCSFQPRRWVVI